MSAMQARVLLAVSAQTLARLQAVLAGQDTLWARTVGEVRAALESGHFDLVIVGSHFDESHTFDIISLVRLRDEHTRIVCVRGRPFPAGLGASTMKAFETASQVLGASLVVDLLDYPDDEAGNRAVRALIEEQITSSFSSPRAA